MKKMVVLLAVMVMSMGASAWAADVAVNPKLEQAKALRVEAAKLEMQASELLKKAVELMIEVHKKPGENMRGGDYVCQVSCSNRGYDYYTCQKACGF